MVIQENWMHSLAHWEQSKRGMSDLAGLVYRDLQQMLARLEARPRRLLA